MFIDFNLWLSECLLPFVFVYFIFLFYLFILYAHFTLYVYFIDTPHDYQPPGFRRANDKEYDFLKQSKSNAAIVADVKTPWHSLGVGRPTENRPKNIHEHDADNIPRTKIQHCNESDLTLDLKNLAMSIKENVTPVFGTVKYPATDAEPVAAHGSHVDTGKLKLNWIEFMSKPL